MSRPLLSKALVYSGVPGTLELVELEIPSLGNDQALVRVDGCTLCGSDLHSLHGRRKVPIPTVLGHEIVGTLVELGDLFPRFDILGQPLSIGSRITWSIVAHCGKCFYCQRGLEQKCEHACKYGHMGFESGYALSGGLAEYCMLAPGTSPIKVPEKMPLELITPASCATATVMAAMHCLAAPPLHQSHIVILGAGMLGLTACAVAKQKGWQKIVVVEPSTSKQALALRFGASHTLTAEDWIDATKDNHGYGCDAVLELSGASSMIAPAIESLRTGGQLVLVGTVFPTPAISVLPEQIVRRQLNLHGVHNYTSQHLVQAVQFLDQYGLDFPLAELVTSWQTLEEVHDWIQRGSTTNAIRLGVRP